MAKQHAMKSFTGADGATYQRRADLSLRLWKQYTEANYTTIFDKAYWVALFMGKLDESTLELSTEERADRAADVLTLDEYYAVQQALFESIIYPAASEHEKKDDASASG